MKKSKSSKKMSKNMRNIITYGLVITFIILFAVGAYRHVKKQSAPQPSSTTTTTYPINPEAQMVALRTAGKTGQYVEPEQYLLDGTFHQGMTCGKEDFPIVREPMSDLFQAQSFASSAYDRCSRLVSPPMNLNPLVINTPAEYNSFAGMQENQEAGQVLIQQNYNVTSGAMEERANPMIDESVIHRHPYYYSHPNLIMDMKPTNTHKYPEQYPAPMQVNKNILKPFSRFVRQTMIPNNAMLGVSTSEQPLNMQTPLSTYAFQATLQGDQGNDVMLPVNYE